MGDVAGIGPEVIARGWLDPRLHALARPIVIGDADVMRRALELVAPENAIRIQVIDCAGGGGPINSDNPLSLTHRRSDRRRRGQAGVG